MSFIERIKLCWLILVTRNVADKALFKAALMVNKCALRGRVIGVADLQMKDGCVVQIEYRLTARQEGSE